MKDRYEIDIEVQISVMVPDIGDGSDSWGRGGCRFLLYPAEPRIWTQDNYPIRASDVLILDRLSMLLCTLWTLALKWQ